MSFFKKLLQIQLDEKRYATILNSSSKESNSTIVSLPNNKGKPKKKLN
jgi:hypothetical protein